MIAVDPDDLRTVVGHEAAELLDGHLDRHRRDQHALDELFGSRLSLEQETLLRLGLVAAGAGPQLHNTITAAFFGQQQGPVGAAEHGFRRIAGLNFGYPKADGGFAAAHLRLRDLAQSAADLIRPASGRSVIAVGTQHDELLAAVSGHQVARPAGVLQQIRQALDYVVAGLMSVRVVNLFEPVQVTDHQAARDLLLLMGLDEHLVDPVEFRAVGHLRHGVLGGLLVQALAPLLQRRLRRSVVEQQDRAQHRAVFGNHRNRMRIHRNGLPGPAGDAQPPQRLHAGTDRGGDRAIGADDGVALFVGHAQQVRTPLTLTDAGTGDTRQPFRPTIPQRHATVGVDEHHRVVHVLQQFRLEQRVGPGRRGRRGNHAELPPGIERTGIERLQPADGDLAVQVGRIAPVQLRKLLDQHRIELRAGTIEQLAHRPFQRHRRAIDPLGGHRVERFGDGNHPGTQGNSIRAQLESVVAAVVPGSDVFDDLKDLGRIAASSEHVQGHPARPGYNPGLIAVECARLQQDVIGHADHSHVVQQGGHLDGVALRRLYSRRPAPGRTGQRHAQGVPRRGRMLALQGGKQTGRGTQPGLNHSVVGAGAQDRLRRNVPRRRIVEPHRRVVKIVKQGTQLRHPTVRRHGRLTRGRRRWRSGCLAGSFRHRCRFRASGFKSRRPSRRPPPTRKSRNNTYRTQRGPFIKT